jgi:hypothetical protein
MTESSVKRHSKPVTGLKRTDFCSCCRTPKYAVPGRTDRLDEQRNRKFVSKLKWTKAQYSDECLTIGSQQDLLIPTYDLLAQQKLTNPRR